MDVKNSVAQVTENAEEIGDQCWKSCINRDQSRFGAESEPLRKQIPAFIPPVQVL